LHHCGQGEKPDAAYLATNNLFVQITRLLQADDFFVTTIEKGGRMDFYVMCIASILQEIGVQAHGFGFRVVNSRKRPTFEPIQGVVSGVVE
jgi:hypothetical protein